MSELTLGRDPSCSIAYDPNKDDVVNRRHAVVRVIKGKKLGFTLGDLKSANGTFLDGQKVTAEIELLPGQTIELGRLRCRAAPGASCGADAND